MEKQKPKEVMIIQRTKEVENQLFPSRKRFYLQVNFKGQR